LAQLDEHREDQPQQQQVADEVGDVRQPAAEHEEREHAAGQRGERDTPLGEPRERGAHTGGGVAGPPGAGVRARRSLRRCAIASRLSTWVQSTTSPAAECTYRCTTTWSTGPDRTSP